MSTLKGELRRGNVVLAQDAQFELNTSADVFGGGVATSGEMILPASTRVEEGGVYEFVLKDGRHGSVRVTQCNQYQGGVSATITVRWQQKAT